MLWLSRPSNVPPNHPPHFRWRIDCPSPDNREPLRLLARPVPAGKRNYRRRGSSSRRIPLLALPWLLAVFRHSKGMELASQFPVWEPCHPPAGEPRRQLSRWLFHLYSSDHATPPLEPLPP